VQRGGKIIRDLSYSLEADSYVGSDLTLMASHLLDEDEYFSAIAYQSNPDSVVWAVTSNGKMFSLTLVREQGVYAWTRHSVFGSVDFPSKVLSVAVIPDEDALFDDVYIAVRRRFGGVYRTFVERMGSRFYEGVAGDGRGHTLDAHLIYDGAPATTIYGLFTFAGETVHIVADGEYVGTQAVSAGGGITLPAEAPGSIVFAGLPFYTAVETLDFLVDGRDGTTLHRVRDLTGAVCYLRNTGDVRVGNAGALTNAAALYDSGISATGELFTGRKELGIGSSDAYAASVVIRTLEPLPIEVEALVAVVRSGDH